VAYLTSGSLPGLCVWEAYGQSELVQEVAHPGPSNFVQFILEYINAAR